jgi:hypothetical protein
MLMGKKGCVCICICVCTHTHASDWSARRWQSLLVNRKWEEVVWQCGGARVVVFGQALQVSQY